LPSHLRMRSPRIHQSRPHPEARASFVNWLPHPEARASFVTWLPHPEARASFVNWLPHPEVRASFVNWLPHPEVRAERASKERKPVAQDEGRASKERKPVAQDEGRASKERKPVAQDEGRASKERTRIARDVSGSHSRVDRKPPREGRDFRAHHKGHLSAVIARSGEAIDHRKNPAADLPELRSTKPTRRARIG